MFVRVKLFLTFSGQQPIRIRFELLEINNFCAMGFRRSFGLSGIGNVFNNFDRFPLSKVPMVPANVSLRFIKKKNRKKSALKLFNYNRYAVCAYIVGELFPVCAIALKYYVSYLAPKIRELLFIISLYNIRFHCVP